jgi:hypothetical protein
MNVIDSDKHTSLPHLGLNYDHHCLSAMLN